MQSLYNNIYQITFLLKATHNEHSKEKRAWADEVHRILADGTRSHHVCNFTNLVEMTSDDDRYCSVHNDRCPLPSDIDGIIGGISCKDISRNNTSKQKLVGAALYAAESSRGGSADCMHGLLRLIDEVHPKWIVAEQSEDLAEGAQYKETFDMLMHDICSRGFDVRVFILDSSEFALPQHRKRMWMLALERPSKMFVIPNYNKFFDEVGALIQALHLLP